MGYFLNSLITISEVPHGGYFLNSDETSHCKSDQKRYQRMHSTCNRCTNRLALRPLNRLKHRCPVPAKSPLVQGRGGLEGRAGLFVIHYSICMHALVRGRTFVDFATSHASVALRAKHC